MRSHRFSLFGHTLVTREDFSHSLLPELSENSTDSDIELIVKRQQKAPVNNAFEQIFPDNDVSKNQPASLYLYKTDNIIRIVYIDFAIYDIIDRRIICYPGSQTNEMQLHLNFLGPVMSMWLEQNGFQVLHASAVLIEQKVALFLADSQQGKSTIAALFIKKGYPLLSDDLVAIKYNQEEQKFYAYPAYPVIKLWPDQFDSLFKDNASALFLDKELRKCRVRVDSLNPELFCNQPQPLSIIYHLNRGDNFNRLTVQPLSNMQAMTKLIRYSFAAPIMIVMKWQPQRLASFSRLCLTHQNIRELKYPSGMAELDLLSEQIVTDFNANTTSLV